MEELAGPFTDACGAKKLLKLGIDCGTPIKGVIKWIGDAAPPNRRSDFDGNCFVSVSYVLKIFLNLNAGAASENNTLDKRTVKASVETHEKHLKINKNHFVKNILKRQQKKMQFKLVKHKNIKI